MKAMTLTGLRKMELREVPEPRIRKDTDVLLQVGAVGVCGSDVHYYARGRIGSQAVRYPFRLGHEFAGVVLETGRKAGRLRRGDRVAVDPAMSCGRCDQCRAGRRHTCRNLRFLGCPGQAEGCLCEFIVMPEPCCFPVRRGTSLEQAALAEPLSIGVYAARLADLVPRARIGVLGCGPIGLSVILAARAAGIRRIYATDPIRERRRAAERAGAAETGNPDGDDVVAAVARQTPSLLDAVFECCGQQKALDQAVRMLKPGGRLLLVGIPGVARVSFEIDLLRRREIRVQNVRRQNECTQAALDLIEKKGVDADFLITHRFPLARARKAFDLVAGYRDGVVKAMIG